MCFITVADRKLEPHCDQLLAFRGFDANVGGILILISDLVQLPDETVLCGDLVAFCLSGLSGFLKALISLWDLYAGGYIIRQQARFCFLCGLNPHSHTYFADWNPQCSSGEK